MINLENADALLGHRFYIGEEIFDVGEEIFDVT